MSIIGQQFIDYNPDIEYDLMLFIKVSSGSIYLRVIFQLFLTVRDFMNKMIWKNMRLFFNYADKKWRSVK